MATIELNGIGFAYDDEGSGSPAIVWVHGGTTNRAYWHRCQLPAFTPAHRCVAVDLRGHGESGTPPGPWSLADFASDVAALIDALGLDRPIVVGHSFGCAVGLQLAADHPFSLRALVLDDAPPLDAAALQGFVPLIEGFESGAPVPEVMDQLFTAAGFFLPGHDPSLRADVIKTVTATNTAAALMARSLTTWHPAAIFGRVQVPTLHLAAANVLCPDEQMVAAIPHVVLGRTVGAGHFNAWEVPGQVNSMIAEFIREYVG